MKLTLNTSSNQIMMAEKDVSHKSFCADNDIYHYIVMPFELISTCATYKRLVNKLFVDMMGDTMNAYVDKILMKFKVGIDH